MERDHVDKVLNVLRQTLVNEGAVIREETAFNRCFEDCFVIDRALQAMITSVMLLRDAIGDALHDKPMSAHTSPCFALSMRYDMVIGMAVAHSARLEMGMTELNSWALDVMDRGMGKQVFTARILADHFYRLILDYRDMYRQMAERHYQVYRDANVPLDLYFDKIGLKEYKLIYSESNT